MESGNWPPDTQSPFPRRKTEMPRRVPKGTLLCGFLHNLTSHSVALWQAQVTSLPSVEQGVMLVLLTCAVDFGPGVSSALQTRE